MEKAKAAFNENQKRLQAAIAAKAYEEVIALALEQNALSHCAKVSGAPSPTKEDELWEVEDERAFTAFSSGKLYSVAWHLWHAARIEDICAHFFFSRGEQVLEAKGYREKLGCISATTGNEFDEDGMRDFNAAVNLSQLRKYRNAVGAETRRILGKTAPERLGDKVRAEDIEAIASGGYVGRGAEWLLEFWGKKKLSGIVSMPLARHPMVHVNEARRIMKLK